MSSKKTIPYEALQNEISSALYRLGKFDPRDTNLRRLHVDLVGNFVHGLLARTLWATGTPTALNNHPLGDL